MIRCRRARTTKDIEGRQGGLEEALIEVRNLCKLYNPGENEVRALDHVNLRINRGELVGIIGHSGSGK